MSELFELLQHSSATRTTSLTTTPTTEKGGKETKESPAKRSRKGKSPGPADDKDSIRRFLGGKEDST